MIKNKFKNINEETEEVCWGSIKRKAMAKMLPHGKKSNIYRANSP